MKHRLQTSITLSFYIKFTGHILLVWRTNMVNSSHFDMFSWCVVHFLPTMHICLCISSALPPTCPLAISDDGSALTRLRQNIDDDTHNLPHGRRLNSWCAVVAASLPTAPNPQETLQFHHWESNTKITKHLGIKPLQFGCSKNKGVHITIKPLYLVVHIQKKCCWNCCQVETWTTTAQFCDYLVLAFTLRRLI